MLAGGTWVRSAMTSPLVRLAPFRSFHRKIHVSHSPSDLHIMLSNTSEAKSVGRWFEGLVGAVLGLLVKAGIIRGHVELMPAVPTPLELQRDHPPSPLKSNFLSGMDDLPTWHFRDGNLALGDGDAFQKERRPVNAPSTPNPSRPHGRLAETSRFHRSQHDSFVANRKTASLPRR